MTNAVRKELTKEITCKCKQEIVLIRTSNKVTKTTFKCPACGRVMTVVY